MKVLMVNGSPHREGCTYTALSEVAGALTACGIESEIITIGQASIAGCLGCGKCISSGECVFADAVNDFVKKARQADGFVFGSPVHYAAPSGALTCFMDRVFYSSMRKPLSGKPAAAVVSCRRGGATAAFDQINKYFLISGMPIVSSQYWNMVHGNTPDEVRQDLEGLQIMRTLGRNMAWLIKCIAQGRENGTDFPTPEKRVWTNFVRK